jgi:hypothetical protein
MLSPLLTRALYQISQARRADAIEPNSFGLLAMEHETLKTQIWREYVRASGNKNLHLASLLGILYGRIQKRSKLLHDGVTVITQEQLNRIRADIDNINFSALLLSKNPCTRTRLDHPLQLQPSPSRKWKDQQRLPPIPEETDLDLLL